MVSRRFSLHPLAGLVVALLHGCAASPQVAEDPANRDPDALLIVDCLLPGKVRQLGTRLTYQAPRQPIKTSATVCEIRGGEYTAYDRSNFATALKIWLPRAEGGDAEAQTYVGEIYEKGLGIPADYRAAALWYERAADQGDSRAMINLGYLHEAGLGLRADLTTAMNWYRRASGLTDGDLEYVSSVEFANREAATARTRALEERVVELQASLQQSESRLAAQRTSVNEDQRSIETLRARVSEQRRVLAARASEADANSGSEDRETAERVQRLQALETELASSRAQRETLERELGAQQQAARIAQQALSKANAERAGEELTIAERGPAEALVEQANAGSAEQQAALQQAQAETTRLQQALDAQADQLADLESRQRTAQADYREHLVALQASLGISRQEQARLVDRLAGAELQAAASADALDEREQQLAHARDEQGRLTERLRDEQVDATRRERSDAVIIAGLDQVIADREQQLQRQSARLDELQDGLTGMEQKLAAEPNDTPDRVRLQGELDQRNADILSARAEQSRLSEALRDEQLSARANQLDSAQQLALLESALSERETEVNLQQQQLAMLEQEVLQARVQLQDRDADKSTQVVATGPLIDIIDPPLLVTRGAPTLPLVDNQVDLVGRVTPSASLLTLRINGSNQSWNEAGVFRFASTPGDALEVVAVDEAGQSTRLALAVAQGGTVPGTQAGAGPDAPVPVPAGVDFGNYHALVIGNNQHARLSTLNTAENDARTVDRILRESYGFQSTLLLNATRNDILAALSDLRETLDSDDNLLIYYAGHGEIDAQTRLGYWLPVDADPQDSSQWIANTAITDMVSALPARHVLMVVDSCYSGTLTRSSVARQPPALSPELRARWYEAMAQSRVRSVLSSGGVRPVFDGRPGAEHSLFARAFIDELRGNREVLEGYQLFVNVQRSVSAAARGLNVEQNPGYAPIRHAGHEAGEFLFVPARDTRAGLEEALDRGA